MAFLHLILFPTLLSMAMGIFSIPAPAMCNGSAMYQVNITNDVTSSNFPNITTSPIVLSPPVVWSQAERFSALVLYGYATPGVQDVAETGATAKLEAELTEGLGSTFVKDVAIGTGPIMPGTTASFTVGVDCKFYFIGLDTMVFPSPDWFVAISRLSVLKRGRFIDFAVQRLRVYDAGTDSGLTLEAEDSVTSPVENIHRLEGAPFFEQPVATVVVKRIG